MVCLITPIFGIEPLATFSVQSIFFPDFIAFSSKHFSENELSFCCTQHRISAGYLCTTERLETFFLQSYSHFLLFIQSLSFLFSWITLEAYKDVNHECFLKAFWSFLFYKRFCSKFWTITSTCICIAGKFKIIIFLTRILTNKSLTIEYSILLPLSRLQHNFQ